MKKIHFVDNKPYYFDLSTSSLIGGAIALVAFLVSFSNDHVYLTYATIVFGLVFQHLFPKKPKKSHLATDGDEIYLHGIPAALRKKTPIFSQPCIRITSLTANNGYYRIRVYKNWVTEDDWQLMLKECS